MISTLPPPPDRVPQPEPASTPAPDAAPTQRSSVPTPTNTVVAVLNIDDVQLAHEAAFSLALDACKLGRSVAYLHANPANANISFAHDGTHHLGDAVSSIPTASGRLVRVDIGGLTRLQVVDVLSSVQPLVDQVVLSGPGTALTQLSLEFAVIADSAVFAGGDTSDQAHLSQILNQLGVAHRQIAHAEQTGSRATGSPEMGSPQSLRKITPPGRL